MKIGFLGLLTLVFIVLELIYYIYWSWVWALSPLLLVFSVVIDILFILALVGIVEITMKFKE